MASEQSFDLIVVGAGIIGLAHALAAARENLRVLVLDRETHAVGASIRNFGFITVTGQEDGITWRRARRSRDVWAEVAPAAGIEIVHRGTYVCARRPEAFACLEEFQATPMGAECKMLGAAELASVAQGAFRDDLRGALFSPHELRVESRTALPRLQSLSRRALWRRFQNAHGASRASARGAWRRAAARSPRP